MVQLEVGVAVANDIENDISKLGVGTSFKILPKVALGAGVMITPFEIDDDYEIMYNVNITWEDSILWVDL